MIKKTCFNNYTMKVLWKYSFYVVIFFLYGLLYLIPDKESMENRALKKFPKISQENFGNYSSEFEEWFNDHLPCKNYITSVYARYLLTFNDSIKEQYIIGDNFWLFYDSAVVFDGDSIGQYTGKKTYTLEEKELFLRKLVYISEKIKGIGAELILFVPSNKEEIYDIYMPKRFNKASDNNCCDELMNYLQNKTDIKVIYPKEELLEHRDRTKLYYKYDTHWNQLGAFIAVQEIEKAIGHEKYEIDDITIILNGETSEGGVSSRMGISNYLPPEELFTIEEYQENNIGLKNQMDKRILVVGDSFGIDPLIFLKKDFKEAQHIYRTDCDLNYIKQYSPDVVVLEFVERYIDALLDMEL